MTFNAYDRLDEVDWRILEELQDDARLSFSELGRRVAMSSPAVAERVRRLEESGIIVGYHAIVDPERLGRPIRAFVRLRPEPRDRRRVESFLVDRPEIVEGHHVTGDDCYVVRVAVQTMDDLEEIVSLLGEFGPTTTSIVFRTPVPRRTFRQEPSHEEQAASA